MRRYEYLNLKQHYPKEPAPRPTNWKIDDLKAELNLEKYTQPIQEIRWLDAEIEKILTFHEGKSQELQEDE